MTTNLMETKTFSQGDAGGAGEILLPEQNPRIVLLLPLPPPLPPPLLLLLSLLLLPC